MSCLTSSFSIKRKHVMTNSRSYPCQAWGTNLSSLKPTLHRVPARHIMLATSLVLCRLLDVLLALPTLTRCMILGGAA